MNAIKLVPTQDQIKEAQRCYTGRQFNGNTERKDGRGQLIGKLGEIVFRDWLNDRHIEHEYVADRKDFHDFEIAGRKVDVKSKRRTVAMRGGYMVHVETRIERMDCDYYLFTNVVVSDDGRPTLVELLGYQPKHIFWRLANKYGAGEKDSEGFSETMAAGKVKAENLRSMQDFLDRVELRLYQLAFGEVK